MSDSKKQKWVFPARFRRNAYSWRGSKPAAKRIKEAVREIRKAARSDPALGAEGAVRFMEKLSPALEHIDTSSGTLGTAVDNAIEVIAPMIAGADVPDALRDKWLERLWQAVEEDEIPYLEQLSDYWGDLCVTAERANRWAEEFLPATRLVLSPNRQRRYIYFKGTSACLSALLTAGRYQDILDLLGIEPDNIWSYTQYGVKALLASDRPAEALQYAEKCRGLNQPDGIISQTCEEILLSRGKFDEAYRLYAIEANQRNTYLATFRAIMRKYPDMEPAEILQDLVASTPGSEGKWFAAARSAGLLDEALHLARSSPCEPKTLIRAVGELTAEKPEIAVEIGLAALHWLAEGYGYEITGVDVMDAVRKTLKAGAKAGNIQEIEIRIKRMVKVAPDVDQFFENYAEMELLRYMSKRLDSRN